MFPFLSVISISAVLPLLCKLQISNYKSLTSSPSRSRRNPRSSKTHSTNSATAPTGSPARSHLRPSPSLCRRTYPPPDGSSQSPPAPRNNRVSPPTRARVVLSCSSHRLSHAQHHL